MKRLKHKWDMDLTLEYCIPDAANCVFCGINSGMVWISMHIKKCQSLLKLEGSARLKAEIRYYNKFKPCLTEDEFLIKSIIE
jgi:hypothetical protein